MKYIIFGSIISLALSHPNQRERVDNGLVKPVMLNKVSPDNTIVKVDTMAEDINEIRYGKISINADPDDFPALHPIIMHFAISLIVVAALLQIMNVFFFKKDIAWIIFLLIVTGFVAALLSFGTLHPQTSVITEQGNEILEFYDLWAQWTLRTTFAAMILQIIHLGMTRFDKFAPASSPKSGVSSRKNRLIMLIIASMMVVSAYSILRSGHYGTQLVRNEGMSQGVNFLQNRD